MTYSGVQVDLTGTASILECIDQQSNSKFDVREYRNSCFVNDDGITYTDGNRKNFVMLPKPEIAV